MRHESTKSTLGGGGRQTENARHKKYIYICCARVKPLSHIWNGFLAVTRHGGWDSPGHPSSLCSWSRHLIWNLNPASVSHCSTTKPVKPQPCYNGDKLHPKCLIPQTLPPPLASHGPLNGCVIVLIVKGLIWSHLELTFKTPPQSDCSASRASVCVRVGGCARTWRGSRFGLHVRHLPWNSFRQQHFDTADDNGTRH